MARVEDYLGSTVHVASVSIDQFSCPASFQLRMYLRLNPKPYKP